MSMRRIVSLTAFLSFLVTFLTSIILYIVPEGRVAYWADWRLWGLSKEQWGAIHINVGFLFLLALLLHIYYNWKPIVTYLKNKAKQVSIFTKEFNAALVLTALFVFGTYFGIPPFSTIIHFGKSFKDAAAEKYGEPPYGHAELSSVKTFAKQVNIDLEKGMLLLRQAGYRVDSDAWTLKEIAEQSGVSPQQVFLAMSDAIQTAEQSVGLPEKPAPGVGNLTLADFCTQYHLNVKMIMRSLKDAGITSEADMTIKEIGEANQTGAIEVYEQIRSIADRSNEQ